MILATLLAGAALAQAPIEGAGGSSERAGGPFGIGVAIGAPAGATGRLWLGDWSAIQFTAGGDLGSFKRLGGTADYVVTFRPFQVEDNAYAIPLHIGGGVNIDLDLAGATGVVLIGPRAVFGASLMVPDLPVDFHAEIAPTVYFLEQPGWSVDGQIGFRYYL
jgi:hypothetical protein